MPEVPEPAPGCQLVPFADSDQADAWLARERGTLIAVVELAESYHLDRYVCHLAWAVGGYFDRQGHWTDLIAVQHMAVRAAARHPDLSARAHLGLGSSYGRIGDYDEALHHLGIAREAFAAEGEHGWHARIHLHLAWIAEQQRRFADALALVEASVPLYRQAGDLAGEANALNASGWYHSLLGAYDEALRQCRAALALHERRGDRYGQAETLDSIGHTCHHLGRFDEAERCYRRSLELIRVLGDRWGEATTLDHLGDLHLAAGRREEARSAWQPALKILRELGAPNADEVARKLAG